jgi:hypothetical protein
MRDIKPFASLSSGLLARKGAAKPAMRPQGFNSYGGHLDDLGWNDMGHADTGHEETAPLPAQVAPLTGSAGLTPAPRPAAPEPVVVAHQRALEESFAVEAPVAEQAHAIDRGRVVEMTLPRRRGEPCKAKAAFTLRLDSERHLKLRLACALTRRSAQQLVTGALDEFLSSFPEVDRLADRLPVEASGR